MTRDLRRLLAGLFGTFALGSGLLAACIDASSPPEATPGDSDAGSTPEKDGATTSDATTPPVQDGGSEDTGTVTPPACDAPNTACGSSCVDLQTSDDHCGKCGRSCGGAGCDKGACKPVDLLDGLTYPTTIGTNPKVGQVFVNIEGRVVRCAKTGCGKSLTPLWEPTRYKTNETSPVALTEKAVATLVYDASNNDAQRFLPISQTVQSPSSTPTTYESPDYSLQNLAGDPTSAGVAAQAAYGIYACASGICMKGSTGVVKYAGEDGETTVAIQPGTPGYYAWPTYGNIHYCERGLASECSSKKNLVTTPITQPLDKLVVTAKTAYWVTKAPSGYQVLSCAFPEGCTVPRVVAEALEAVDGFAADDRGVYWTARNNGLLFACEDLEKGCGTTPKTLLSNLAQPYAIALDDQHLFFTQRGGVAGQGRVTRLVR